MIDRVLGVLIIGYGALLVVGAIALLISRTSRISEPILFMEAVMGAATVAGGIYIVRGGFRKGRPGLIVLSILPVSLLIALSILGVVTRQAVAHSPQDAYGYTEFEKQSFVSGCGGGSRCECLFEAIERQIPHEEFVAESVNAARTGSLSPEMTAKITRISQASGC